MAYTLKSSELLMAPSLNISSESNIKKERTCIENGKERTIQYKKKSEQKGGKGIERKKETNKGMNRKREKKEI